MAAPVVTIEKLAFGGAGFGHWEGKACFVPFTAPGDTVRIDIVQEKRSFINGRVRELLTPSERRATPPCEVFGRCGGCQWQHIPYEVQLQQKLEIFTGLMERIARVDAGLIESVVPASLPFGYRSRVQLKVRQVAGKVHMGFYRTGSHFVIDIPDVCPIAAPAVNALIGELRTLMESFPEPDKIPQLDVATGENGASIVVFHYIGTDPGAASGFIAANRGLVSSATGLWLQSGRKNTLTQIWGSGALTYLVPTGSGSGASKLDVQFSRGGFSQVNYRQNEVLVGTAVEWAELKGTEQVLDLYCGNGNISLPLALNAGRVTGIEEYQPSLTDAAQNCRMHCIGNAAFECSDVMEWLNKAVAGGEKYDIVVLDPPRSGAKEAMSLLPRLYPRAVIYISCDPATMARDLAIIKKHGFDCVKSLPVDMFPQTYHLESVTLLKPC